MNKYLHLIIIYIFSIFNICNAESNVFYNFASSLTNNSDGKVLLVHSERIASENLKTKESIQLRKNPSIETFARKGYPISVILTVVESFCTSVNELIFLKKDLRLISDYDSFNNSIFLERGCYWLIIVDSMYDTNDNLKINENEKFRFEGISEYEFINKNSFFKLANPQNANAIRLELNPDSIGKVDKIIVNQKLIEDVRTLSNLFCGKLIYNLSDIELLNKTLPMLESEEGKKIGNAMINIIEGKIIQSELPEEFKGKSHNLLDMLNIDAVEKVYNNRTFGL